jgi:predicted SAM-dependent methyltransferase
MFRIGNILLKFFSHQTLALLRWDIHLIWMRVINFVFLKERQLHKRLQELNHPLYLNLGSGPRGLTSDNWINVDGCKDINVDYCMDFNKKFPFSDNCLDGIFCEHVLEHFNIENGQRLLRECFRVLQPGGCLRIIVPDGEKIMKAYFDNPSELLDQRSVATSCAMEAVNSYFRQRYEHQIAYDEELLEQQISLAGFTRVSRVSFGKGNFSGAVIIDNEKYEWESLYVEAVK